MHVIVGIVGFAAVLVGAIVLEGIDRTFSGLVYRPAIFLLVAGPPFVALISHDVRELGTTVRDLLACIRRPPHRSRAQLSALVAKFAEELRRGRASEALAIADGAPHDLFRGLAPLAVKRYGTAELERTAAATIAVRHSAQRRSEDVLTGLARVAPATGLIGTTLGLIALLRELRNFEQLGPSMALALLCTFYGLLLANAVYQPLARLLHVRAQAAAEEGRLLTQALVLLGEGKPVTDVRALFDEPAARETPGAALALE